MRSEDQGARTRFVEGLRAFIEGYLAEERRRGNERVDRVGIASALLTLSALFAHSAGIDDMADFGTIARSTFENVGRKSKNVRVSA